MTNKKNDKKNKAELDVIKKLSNVWEFLGYMFRYKTKEIMGIIILILAFILIFYIVMTSGYNKKDGLYKKATDTKVEIKRGGE